MAAHDPHGIQWLCADAHGEFRGETFPQLSPGGDSSSIADAIELIRPSAPYTKTTASSRQLFLSSLATCDRTSIALHMNGHGVGGMGVLVKKDEDESVNAVATIPDIVPALFDREDVKFIFLNACQTSGIASAIQQNEDSNVVCAIGTNAYLPDPGYLDMKLFVLKFYTKLLSGLSVSQSLQDASRETVEHIAMANRSNPGFDEVAAFLGGSSSGEFNFDNCKYKLFGDGGFRPWEIRSRRAKPSSEPVTTTQPHMQPQVQPHIQPQPQPHTQPQAQSHIQSQPQPHAQPQAQPGITFILLFSLASKCLPSTESLILISHF